MKKPEELIVFIIFLCWTIATFFIVKYYLEADWKTTLMVTGFTGIWSAICYFLWNQEKIYFIWPIAFGLLVACWWPFLDWLAISPYQEVLLQNKPGFITIAYKWYNSWTFKLILSFIPVIIGYIIIIKNYLKNKKRTVIKGI